MVSRAKICKPRRRRNLAIRLDVMNKNTIRAFKRQLKSEFRNFVSESNLPKSRKANNSNIRIFAMYIQTNVPSECQGNQLSFEDLVAYMRILINYCQLKRPELTEEELVKVDETQAVFYNYTHQKFYDFLTKPEISVLFHYIINKMGVESFVQSFVKATGDKLSKGPGQLEHKYHSHIKKLMSNSSS